MKKYCISVVIPAFNEADNIAPLLKRLIAVLEKYPDYEVIFVDDGSTDSTAHIIEKMRQKNNKIHLISFARNFGHQTALRAGLDYAKGDAVISMDADLQHPPELIDTLIQKWQKGADIVYTVRQNTVGVGYFKKISSFLFYRFFNFLTGIMLPRGSADFRLLDKKAVNALRLYSEKTLFLRGVIAQLGFVQEAVEYVAQKRFAGQSHYTLKKMLSLAFVGATSFGVRPLRMAIWLGLIVACCGICFTLYVLWQRLFGYSVISGWASMMCVTLVLGGAQLFVMGIIGEYIGLIFMETKNRPKYLIKKETKKCVSLKKL